MRRIAAVVAAGALLLLAGCNDGGNSAASGHPSAASTSQAPPAQVVIDPANGTADVSPVVPLQVTVTGGRLQDVVVTDARGTAVPGKAAPSSTDPKTQVWTPKGRLAYGTTYTLTATAQNAARKTATATSTFTTVTPTSVTTPAIGPLNGMTVGVGLPIRVYFDHKVADADKAEVQRHLQVTSSTPTDGVWHWMDDEEVHFRPSTYWPANTDVTLDANLYGIELGDGVWGEKNREVSFHIGARHVSVADAAAHTLTVYNGDEAVQSFPMSAGSNVNPTRNGPHVVTEMNRRMVMDSSTFGLAVDAPGGYRADVEYAVRISNNGEFVHSAPWSVADQGKRNVSHGCINLSPARAEWFFHFSQPGDVVEVKNSVGPTLSAADGDIYDWAIPWDQWKAGSALK